MSKIGRLLEELEDESMVKAVEKATDEFDEIGQDEFLEKYKFGKARTSWLTRNGKQYDSKAIIGVAYRIVTSRQLKPIDFHGGNPVLIELSRLGFECYKEKDGKKIPFKQIS